LSHIARLHVDVPDLGVDIGVRRGVLEGSVLVAARICVGRRGGVGQDELLDV